MKFILPLSLLTILAVGLFLLKSVSQNPHELAVAYQHDGTVAFYKQLISSNGDFVENAGEAVFDNQPIKSITKEETESILVKATEEQKLASGNLDNQILGLHTAPDGSEKWIEIDLTDYKLYAWEGNRKVYEFSISTGRPGYKTPTGEFRVWRKVLSQRYKGGIPGTDGYYNLPNVPYSLFFGGGDVPNWKGYAIHGAYWHNDFGIKNRSSGCVNVEPEEAALLYNWAGPAMSAGIGTLNATTDNPGIRIVIHD